MVSVVASTKGCTKELIYFNSYPDRFTASTIEAQLKDDNQGNAGSKRNVRKMIKEFEINLKMNLYKKL